MNFLIFLQLGFFEWFKVGGENKEILLLNDFIIPIGIIGLLIFVAWKVIKARNVRNSFPPGRGTALGYMALEIQEEKSIEGFVRRYDFPLLASTKEKLKKIPYMKDILPEIESLQKKKLFTVYEMRTNIVEGLKDIASHGQDIMIISIGHPLDSDEVSYEHMLEKRGMFATGIERKRKILCAATSRFHDITTPDGIKDVYVVSPIPKPDIEKIKKFGVAGQQIITDGEEIKNPLYLQVNVVSDTENFARVIAFMEAVVVAESEIEKKTRRIDELIDVNADLQEKIIEFQRKEDIYRYRLGEQKLIGLTTPPFFPFRGEPWAWHVVFAVAPLVGYILTPEFTRQIPPWLGSIFALGMMIGIRFLSLRGQKRAEDQEIQQSMM